MKILMTIIFFLFWCSSFSQEKGEYQNMKIAAIKYERLEKITSYTGVGVGIIGTAFCLNKKTKTVGYCAVATSFALLSGTVYFAIKGAKCEMRASPGYIALVF